jgi:hypothetical protein
MTAVFKPAKPYGADQLNLLVANFVQAFGEEQNHEHYL